MIQVLNDHFGKSVILFMIYAKSSYAYSQE